MTEINIIDAYHRYTGSSHCARFDTRGTRSKHFAQVSKRHTSDLNDERNRQFDVLFVTHSGQL